ncbi:MAG: bifunctional riboflavin kinase/FAD synthetase [Weeksellaceae bacterium]|jgi:riboflavin kinase/FMN adenylyltransferase|nr:bifunctional riboflavin kinase/FAD synthetase [Weeksellaceae bacterium]
MKIIQNISAAKNIHKPVLTLGVYDGIHIGHQAIINQLNQMACEVGGESVLLTFEPHPRITLNKGAESLQLLTTLDEKKELLEKYGLQNLIIHPFTKEFSQLNAEEFVKLLKEEIGIHSMVIGYDHHFGKNRSGNYDELSRLAKIFDFNCIKINEIQANGHLVSSTQIRNALLEGNIELAGLGLNRNYSLRGKVIHGDKIGRTLGYPTANLKTSSYKLIPGNGVYIVKVLLGEESFKGLLSIGTRPTISRTNEKRTEVYILDFDRDIYNETLEIEFLKKIRDDQKFDSVLQLVQQMDSDKAQAENFEWDI